MEDRKSSASALFPFGMPLREQGANEEEKSQTVPYFFLEFSAIGFSTIFAIMIELKLLRWCFLFYNFLVFELELEIHQDFLFLLVLIFVFVSWILIRSLWNFNYKNCCCKNSWVPEIEITWTISTCVIIIIYLAGLVEIAECAGGNSGEGASTSFPKPEWQIALDLPKNQVAPECLRSHIKEQLRYLFNIGRKKTLPDAMFNNFIDPLNLDEAKVGFAKALLERVNALQLVHYNRGDHIPFKFSTREEKERLYSIVWEYADKLPPE